MRTIRLMTSFAVVLFAITATAQTAKYTYVPKLPQVEINIAKNNLVRILKSTTVWQSGPNYTPPPPISEIRNVSVFDNSIQIDYKKSHETFYFSEIFQNEIVVLYCEGKPNYPCIVQLGNYYFSLTSLQDGELTKELADYLFYFQHFSAHTVQRYDSLISIFKPITEKYLALEVKPTVSEEQRKYIVQANGFNEQKEYARAIELYKKAIEVDQTAYPSAYSNLALLSAQISDFQAAIYYMKKYLMLEPESTDARSCQDKIYLWEAQLGL